MRAMLTVGLIAALFSPSLASARDDAAIPLAKASKWEINYAADSCQLLGRFGSGESSVIFALTREQPGDAFDLQIYGKLLRYDGFVLPIELGFGREVRPAKFHGTALTMGGAERLPVVRIAHLRIDGSGEQKQLALTAITQAQEAAITAITFKMPGGKKYRLETGSMGAPLAAMRVCTRNLIEAWGYDPAIEESLNNRAYPINSPAGWLGTNDFPEASWMKGHNGLVRFRIDVDASGLPASCHVLYRTNPDEFADLSCRLLMKRARFMPALDAAGKPVKSYYINDIRWIASDE